MLSSPKGERNGNDRKFGFEYAEVEGFMGILSGLHPDLCTYWYLTFVIFTSDICTYLHLTCVHIYILTFFIFTSWHSHCWAGADWQGNRIFIPGRRNISGWGALGGNAPTLREPLSSVQDRVGACSALFLQPGSSPARLFQGQCWQGGADSINVESNIRTGNPEQQQKHWIVTSSLASSPSTFPNPFYQHFFTFCCFCLFYYFSASPSLAKSTFFSFQFCPVQSVANCHFFQLVLNIQIPPTHSKIYLTWLFTADFHL